MGNNISTHSPNTQTAAINKNMTTNRKMGKIIRISQSTEKINVSGPKHEKSFTYWYRQENVS